MFRNLNLKCLNTFVWLHFQLKYNSMINLRFFYREKSKAPVKVLEKNLDFSGIDGIYKHSNEIELK